MDIKAFTSICKTLEKYDNKEKAENAVILYGLVKDVAKRLYTKHAYELIKQSDLYNFAEKNSEFWSMVEQLKSIITKRKKQYGVSWCQKEFIRQLACEGKQAEMIKFLATWQHISHVCYEPLFDIVDDKSDDGYSDFLDALPLVGCKQIEGILIGYYKEGSYDILRNDIKLVTQELYEVVMNGENYFLSNMLEKLMDFLPMYYADQNPELGEEFYKRA